MLSRVNAWNEGFRVQENRANYWIIWMGSSTNRSYLLEYQVNQKYEVFLAKTHFTDHHIFISTKLSPKSSEVVMLSGWMCDACEMKVLEFNITEQILYALLFSTIYNDIVLYSSRRLYTPEKHSRSPFNFHSINDLKNLS